MKTRREFIIDSCKLCLLLSTAGVGVSLLEGCKTIASVRATTTEDHKLAVPLTAFAEHTQVIVSSKLSEFDIFVNKKSETEYTALLMECTHQNQPLTATTTSLTCSAHGSKFDLDGNVMLSPANRRLTRYPVTIGDTNIYIALTPVP